MQSFRSESCLPLLCQLCLWVLVHAVLSTRNSPLPTCSPSLFFFFFFFAYLHFSKPRNCLIHRSLPSLCECPVLPSLGRWLGKHYNVLPDPFQWRTYPSYWECLRTVLSFLLPRGNGLRWGELPSLRSHPLPGLLVFYDPRVEKVEKARKSGPNLWKSSRAILFPEWPKGLASAQFYFLPLPPKVLTPRASWQHWCINLLSPNLLPGEALSSYVS